MKFLLVTDTHHLGQETEALHRAFWKDVRAKESFDAILHTGDWGRTELAHVRESFQVIREENPDTPIYSVLGNHDLWSSQKSLSLETRLDTISKYALNNGIDLIERNPCIIGDIAIVGFMGWYGVDQPPTNDHRYLPTYTNQGTANAWLQRHAFESYKDVGNLNLEGKKVVFLSHFPVVKEIMDRVELSGNAHFGPLVLDIADIYCFGHSHQRVDTTVGKTRILNAGAEYDHFPKYIIFDL